MTKSKRTKHKKYRGVAGYVGMPGSGKTYSLVQLASKALASGLPVYSNAGFDIKGGEQYRSFAEMVSIPGPALILIDEAPILFSSRRWAEFEDGVLYRLTQVRKDGLRVAWSGIHEEMADVTLRRLTVFYYSCRAITAKLFVRNQWDPRSFRRQNQKPRRREWVRVRPEVYELYDTMGKVAAPTAVLERIETADGKTWRRPDMVPAFNGFDLPKAEPVRVAPAAVTGDGVTAGGHVERDPWGVQQERPLGRSWVDPHGLYRD